MEDFAASILKDYASTLELIEKFGSVFVALVAAGIAGIIAYRQWKTAYDRLRLDLFERRYSMFESVMKTLAGVVSAGTITHNNQVQLIRTLRGAEFLFDRDMEEYLKDLRLKLVELEYREEEIRKEPTDPDMPTHVAKAREVKNLLEAEFREGVIRRFRKYLSFGHLK